MADLEVHNPVAESLRERVEPATRLEDLDGRRIGLYWNFKSGGDIALARVREQLSERFPGAEFVDFRGSVGFQHRTATAEDIAAISGHCDAVIGTTSD